MALAPPDHRGCVTAMDFALPRRTLLAECRRLYRLATAEESVIPPLTTFAGACWAYAWAMLGTGIGTLAGVVVWLVLYKVMA